MARHLKKPCSVEQLRKRFLYNRRTGEFIWRRTRTIAGCIRPGLHTRITINYIRYYAQDLAWFYVTGKWPLFPVHHKNYEPSDNRWPNLRKVTTSQNIFFGRKRKNNTSGKTGVSFSQSRRVWSAFITVKRIKIHLGQFKQKQLAVAARRYGESTYYGGT